MICFFKSLCRLLSNATKHFGSVAAMQIKNYIPNQLPLLLIISRARSTNEVSTVIQGQLSETIFDLRSMLKRICLNIVLKCEITWLQKKIPAGW